MKLTDEDARAVDFILDADPVPATSAGVQMARAATAQVTDELRSRVEAVRKLLSALDHLPTEEPPADLVSRTLSLIQKSVGASAMPPPSLRPDAEAPPA